MPPAGHRQADRATAHYRWAERYTKRGHVGKAVAHFGRALQLDFGAGVDEKLEPWDTMMKKYASFTVDHIPGNGGGISGSVFYSSQRSDPKARETYETYRGLTTGTTRLVEYEANSADIDERLGNIYDMLAKYEDFDVEHKPVSGPSTGGSFSRSRAMIDMTRQAKTYNGFLNATSGTVRLTSYTLRTPPVADSEHRPNQRPYDHAGEISSEPE